MACTKMKPIRIHDDPKSVPTTPEQHPATGTMHFKKTPKQI